MIEIVDPDYKPHWIRNLPNERYHSDRTAVSSTMLKHILITPANFYYNWNNTDRKETPEMRLGTLFHAAILEPEDFHRRQIISPDFGHQGSPNNRRKKEDWYAALNPDALVLDEDEYATIQGMLNSVYSNHEAVNLLKHGRDVEISGYYRDPLTGLKGRIRPDLIDIEHGYMIDVKTTRDCSHSSFSKSIYQDGYYIQMAMYCEAVKLISGKQIEVPIYLAVEKKPPFVHAIYPIEQNSKLLRMGAYDYQKAMLTLRQCIELNQWPSFLSGCEPIDIPHWVKEEELLF